MANLYSVFQPHGPYLERLSGNQIRIVDLFPGNFNDKIVCRLRVISLAYKTPYKALSYVWGSKTKPETIHLQGFQHRVTKNLTKALRRLREQDRISTLWIDALSINQEDHVERSCQVQMMREIFAHAEEVLVYLGEPQRWRSFQKGLIQTNPVDITENAEILNAFQTKHTRPPNMEAADPEHETSNVVRDMFCFLGLLAQDPHRHIRDLPALHEYDDLFEEIRRLLKLPWWRRIWTVQEVVVPLDVSVIYGLMRVRWDTIMRAVETYCKHRSSCCKDVHDSLHQNTVVLDWLTIESRNIQWSRRQYHQGLGRDLLTLLVSFGGRKCSDPRDRIYALLGLGNDEITGHISADYSKHEAQVFSDVTITFIRLTKSLNVLVLLRSQKSNSSLPSWIPDWSASERERTTRRAISHSATGGEDSLRMIQASLPNDLRTVEGSEAVFCVQGSGSQQLFGDTPGKFKLPVQKSFSEPTLFGVEMSTQNNATYLSILSITTKYIDVVGEVSKIAGAAESEIDLDFIEECARMVNRTDAYSAGEFLRLMCEDRVYSRASSKGEGMVTSRPRSQELWVMSEWLQSRLRDVKDCSFPHLEQILREGNLERGSTAAYLPSSSYVAYSIQMATAQRRLFITKGSIIGLGPRGIQENDTVNYVRGSSIPFVLRQAPPFTFSSDCEVEIWNSSPVEKRLRNIEVEGSNMFSLIGGCYLHKKMFGFPEAYVESAQISFII